MTTCCPRCGTPIIWSVQPFEGGEQLEVSAWSCYCALSDDEWAELGERAADAVGEWDRPRDDGVRRVREDDPA